jgi:hypothetical protein
MKPFTINGETRRLPAPQLHLRAAVKGPVNWLRQADAGREAAAAASR